MHIALVIPAILLAVGLLISLVAIGIDRWRNGPGVKGRLISDGGEEE